jgi:hypothetical protein
MPIARDAGSVIGNCLTRFADAIEKGRFADIRSTDDSDYR